VDTYRTLTDFLGGERANRRQLVLSSSYLVNSGCVLEEQDPELLVGGIESDFFGGQNSPFCYNNNKKEVPSNMVTGSFWEITPQDRNISRK
jgi:hypothetical protein